jgi:hypothetical protein
MGAYRCAICEREVTYESPLPAAYPFCSPRCQLVDLGNWLRGAYSIDRDIQPEELPPGQPPQPDAGSPPRDAEA